MKLLKNVILACSLGMIFQVQTADAQLIMNTTSNNVRGLGVSAANAREAFVARCANTHEANCDDADHATVERVFINVPKAINEL